jgi:hypothetical protein
VAAALDTSDPTCLVVLLSGEVELEETRRVIDVAIPYVAAGASIIVDSTTVTRPLGVSQLGVLTNDMRKLTSRGLRRVAVAAGDAPVMLIVRAFASFTSLIGLDLKVFPSMESARAWLHS